MSTDDRLNALVKKWSNPNEPTDIMLGAQDSTPDYDDLPFDYPDVTPPTMAGAVTERRHRHRWATVHWQTPSGLTPDEEARTAYAICEICGSHRNPIVSRRSKNNRKRGNSLELWFCQQLGLEKVGQMGTEVDGRTPEGFAGNALFTAQVKSGLQFPGWMQRILDGLPRTGGRVPILGIVETPGAGHRRRALVVMTLEDFRDLHGPER